MKKKVLFVCIHNSARSQMAEAFLKSQAGDRFEVESAGLEPGVLNPVVVKVMEEVGIDISNNKTQSVREMIDAGKTFDVVITVCDEANAERCPVFPGKSQRLHWGFPDPSGLEGSFDDKLVETRLIRDQIQKKVQGFLISI